MDGAVHMLPAMHPHVAIGERIALVNDADAKECPCHRDLRLTGELKKFALCLCDEDAVSGKDDRSLRRGDRIGEHLDLTRVTIKLRSVPRKARLNLRLRWMWCSGFTHQRILGDVHVHGARSTTARNVERLGDGVRNLIRTADQVVVLRHWQRDARDVDLLEGILPEQDARNVAGDRNHGDRVEHGGADPRHKVRCARARGAKADAHFPRRAREAVGGVCRRLLVAHQDVAQTGVINEHVIKREDHAARVAPDDVAPLQEECLAECVGADAWAWAAASLNACIAQHLFARTLSRERRTRPCAWHVSRLRHLSPSKNTKPPPLWRGF